MAAVLQIFSLLFVYQVVNGYILLTADLEDVYAIARQIAGSPVAGQLNKIIRRASSLFNQQSKVHKRSDNSEDLDDNEHRVDSFEGYHSDLADRRRNSEDVLGLGKNATYYLQSIKKIFENA